MGYLTFLPYVLALDLLSNITVTKWPIKSNGSVEDSSTPTHTVPSNFDC